MAATTLGLEDLAFVRRSAGNVGSLGWGVLEAQPDGRWNLAPWREGETRVGLKAVDSDTARASPVYLTNDSRCCPTGGCAVSSSTGSRASSRVIVRRSSPARTRHGASGF
jgi:hypothetical protein